MSSPVVARRAHGGPAALDVRERELPATPVSARAVDNRCPAGRVWTTRARTAPSAPPAARWGQEAAADAVVELEEPEVLEPPPDPLDAEDEPDPPEDDEPDADDPDDSEEPDPEPESVAPEPLASEEEPFAEPDDALDSDRESLR